VAGGQPVGQPYNRYLTLLHSKHTGSGVPSSGKKKLTYEDADRSLPSGAQVKANHLFRGFSVWRGTFCLKDHFYTQKSTF
jgi:hypothetical protein